MRVGPPGSEIHGRAGRKPECEPWHGRRTRWPGAMGVDASCCLQGPRGAARFLPGSSPGAEHFSEREGSMWEVACPRRVSLTPEQPDWGGPRLHPQSLLIAFRTPWPCPSTRGSPRGSPGQCTCPSPRDIGASRHVLSQTHADICSPAERHRAVGPQTRSACPGH